MKQTDERRAKIEALMWRLEEKQEAENRKLEQEIGNRRDLPRLTIPSGCLAVAGIAYFPLMVGTIVALESGMGSLAMFLTVAMLGSLAVLVASNTAGGSGSDNFPEGRP